MFAAALAPAPALGQPTGTSPASSRAAATAPASASPVASQTAPQAETGLPDTVWVNVRPYPFALWGPRTSVGAGAGLVVHNLGVDGSHLLLTAAPTLHDQSGTLTIGTTGRPDTQDRFAILDARLRHTDREWLYGIGPRSTLDTRATLETWSWLVRARYGERLWDRRLLVQPHVRVEQTRLRDRVRATDDAFLSSYLRSLPGTDGDLASTLTGLVTGFDVAVDTRDVQIAPTTGVLARVSAERYTELSDATLTFDRLEVEVAGWVPLGGRHRLALRSSFAFTERRSGTVVPFYQLAGLDGRQVPGFDRHRFVGTDRFIAGLQYEFPLFNLGNILSVEGHAGVHAANVYDDLWQQFEPSVAFDEVLPPGNPAGDDGLSTVPLRPAVSAGLYLGPLFRPAPHVDLAVGWSPEGVSGVRFQFVQPLTPLRAPHHRRR